MKKILLIASVLVLAANASYAASLSSGTATAAAAAVYGGVTGAAATAPTPLIKFSTGVRGAVVFSDNASYLIATKHDSGSKIFGTCNTVTNIYWKQSIAAALGATGAELGISTTASSNFVGSGWTSY